MVAAVPRPGIGAFPNLYRTLAEAWRGAPPRLTGAGLPSVHRIELEAKMNRKHAFTISLAAALAAIAGVVAATKSVHLGHTAAAPAAVGSTSIASRTAALDRAEVALRKALAQKPPKLPALPARAHAGSALPAQQPAQRVMYVRPAPRIVTIHRPGGEHEDGHEAEGGHEGGHEGGGFDD
jgi:hypothetical protein